MAHVLSFGKKSIDRIKSNLGNNYTSCAHQVVTAINTTFTSEELSYSIERVTDLQVSCIVDKGMRFEDITYNPSGYPINDKINTDRPKMFSILDIYRAII